MEEILVDDASDNRMTELSVEIVSPSNNSNSNSNSSLSAESSGCSPTAAVAAVAAAATATAAVDEPSTRVMSMLYIQQGKLPANQSNGANGPSSQPQQQQSLLHVVNKSQLAGFNQIVLHGLGPVQIQQSQTQIQPPITIRRQINTVNSSNPVQSQKHILVRKSNASGAQIMPLSSQESQVHSQAGAKSGITYLNTIIKSKSRDSVVIPAGTINSTQIQKSKLVIAPVVSHVAQTTSSTSNNLQNQSSKHVTNLLLPVNIPQQSATAAKQSLNFKPNFNFKFNNGQINTDAKSTITVLRESKTSNATANPPPLHPIAKMSLLNVPKNSNSGDSIKITENPDSAVITPILKKDECNNSEKRKKTISNILRNSGEKRIKKQIFPKSPPRESAAEEINTSESEHEKDKKKDKESDDDITLIKVIQNEEKKPKRSSVSDEIKIEIFKGNLKDVEVIEKSEKINGNINDEEIDEDSAPQNDLNYDTSQILEWKDDVSLPSSMLKVTNLSMPEKNKQKPISEVTHNEFGFVEMEDKTKQSNEEIIDKENMCVTQNSSKSSTPTIVNEQTVDGKRTRSNSVDTFYCCEACGCHGLAAEFDTLTSCSPLCTDYVKAMKQKLRKDKDQNNKEVRPKKKRKKMLQEQSSKDSDKNKESSTKSIDMDEKSKDSEEKCDKLQERIKTEVSDEEDDTKDTNISVLDEESQGEFESKYPWQTGKLGFSWSKYLEHTKTKAAPVKLFKDAFPYSKNNFKVGMKLEGIDPNHPSHYCVLTVAETVGYRIRLHFDGYAENFDFWVNADSMDIFPVGWAEKNGHKLHPPKGYVQSNFNWNAYLKICKATAAPKTLFSSKSSMVPTGFRVGMKLEAVDRKHSSLVCVASVSGVMDSRILVHFDSWDDVYDYWADVSSPYIHPVGWCHHNGHSLTPPNYFKDPQSFSWDAYLRNANSLAAPARAFKQRPPCGFKRGMKLEAVDKRLPQLIRVATVEDVKDHMIKIRFDGWPENHAYWVDDDSTDIHPMGWCSKTGHPLEAPLTQDNLNNRAECGTFGCRGIGHVKGPKFATHNSASGCPYSPQNLNKIKTVTDRLSLKHEVNDVEDEIILERIKAEKQEKVKTDRPEKRFLNFEDKSIKIENIKQEEGDLSDKNEKIEMSDRHVGSKWRNNSDAQTDDDEVIRKRKKRKLNDDSGIMSMLNSNDSGTSNVPYASNMSDKQLRMEIYHSVYNPGYNPLPDAPHIWAKHSSALNRIVSKQTTNPRRWSNEEVIKFILSLPNCREIGSTFRKHNIDGEAFLMMTQEDLVSLLRLRLGPAIKLYNSIVLLRKKAT